jgi:hypothetical protein
VSFGVDEKGLKKKVYAPRGNRPSGVTPKCFSSQVFLLPSFVCLLNLCSPPVPLPPVRPHLELNLLLVDLDVLDLEVNADGRYECRAEGIVCVPEE